MKPSSSCYAKTEQVQLDKSLIDRVTAAPIRHPATEELLLEANTELTQEQIDELREAKVKKLRCWMQMMQKISVSCGIRSSAISNQITICH